MDPVIVEPVVIVEQAMVSVKLFATCIVSMFLAIIGVYIWTFKKLGDIYTLVNGHIQKPNIHTDKKEFVNADVCAVVHKGIDEKMNTIGKDVKTLLTKSS